MHQQVPMVVLLLLVCLSTVYYEYVENTMGSRWRKDILRVKGLVQTTKIKLFCK